MDNKIYYHARQQTNGLYDVMTDDGKVVETGLTIDQAIAKLQELQGQQEPVEDGARWVE